jgi:hypothetical protein
MLHGNTWFIVRKQMFDIPEYTITSNRRIQIGLGVTQSPTLTDALFPHATQSMGWPFASFLEKEQEFCQDIRELYFSGYMLLRFRVSV